jgi:uncharacterized peroxidase-related enzyme
MTRIEPIARAQREDLKPVFSAVEAAMGFLPNSMLIMARKPGLVEAFSALAMQIQTAHSLPAGLAQMVAYLASRSAGCQYCQAHTHHGLAKAVEQKKIDAIWDYETSSLFSDAERAALQVAQKAAHVPNEVDDCDFKELKKHYSEDQIIEIVSIISLFGFLNRWNDTLATPLEDIPAEHAKTSLSSDGWTGEKHL